MKHGHIERGGRAGVHTNVNGQAFPNKFRFLRISDSRRLKAVGKNNRLDSLFTSPPILGPNLLSNVCFKVNMKKKKRKCNANPKPSFRVWLYFKLHQKRQKKVHEVNNLCDRIGVDREHTTAVNG